jgi:hypothetical protein
MWFNKHHDLKQVVGVAVLLSTLFGSCFLFSRAKQAMALRERDVLEGSDVASRSLWSFYTALVSLDAVDITGIEGDLVNCWTVVE